MTPVHQAYVALGANLGNPVQNVQNALHRLKQMEEIRLITASSLYRTAPVGNPDQPDFINAVAHLETSLTPEQLLISLLDLESEFGRQRDEKNGPRLLDLDLLFFDQIEQNNPALTLPHPRLHLRAFVLVPLAEIADPQTLIPGRGVLSAWLPAVANQSIIRLP